MKVGNQMRLGDCTIGTEVSSGIFNFRVVEHDIHHNGKQYTRVEPVTDKDHGGVCNSDYRVIITKIANN